MSQPQTMKKNMMDPELLMEFQYYFCVKLSFRMLQEGVWARTWWNLVHRSNQDRILPDLPLLVALVYPIHICSVWVRLLECFPRMCDLFCFLVVLSSFQWQSPSSRVGALTLLDNHLQDFNASFIFSVRLKLCSGSGRNHWIQVRSEVCFQRWIHCDRNCQKKEFNSDSELKTTNWIRSRNREGRARRGQNRNCCLRLTNRKCTFRVPAPVDSTQRCWKKPAAFFWHFLAKTAFSAFFLPKQLFSVTTKSAEKRPNIMIWGQK